MRIDINLIEDISTYPYAADLLEDNGFKEAAWNLRREKNPTWYSNGFIFDDSDFILSIAEPMGVDWAFKEETTGMVAGKAAKRLREVIARCGPNLGMDYRDDLLEVLKEYTRNCEKYPYALLKVVWSSTENDKELQGEEEPAHEDEGHYSW